MVRVAKAERCGVPSWCTELVSIVGVSQGMRSSLDVAALLKQDIEGLVGVRQHAMGQHFAVPLLPHGHGGDQVAQSASGFGHASRNALSPEIRRSSMSGSLSEKGRKPKRP